MKSNTGGNVRFRAAEAGDVDAIAALHVANWQAAYRGILADDFLFGDLLAERTQVWRERLSTPAANQWIRLADTDRGLAGFACAYGAEDPQHGTLLENLHVAVASRGTGLGVTLIGAVARWSLERHPGAGLHLWALAQNMAARRFYERLGGTVTGDGEWTPPVGPAVAEVRYAWPRPVELLALTGDR